MTAKPKIRWAVEAVFSDGHRVILRDFAWLRPAQDWLIEHEGRDFYPGRVYRLDIRKVELLPDE